MLSFISSIVATLRPNFYKLCIKYVKLLRFTCGSNRFCEGVGLTLVVFSRVSVLVDQLAKLAYKY